MVQKLILQTFCCVLSLVREPEARFQERGHGPNLFWETVLNNLPAVEIGEWGGILKHLERENCLIPVLRDWGGEQLETLPGSSYSYKYLRLRHLVLSGIFQ